MKLSDAQKIQRLRKKNWKLKKELAVLDRDKRWVETQYRLLIEEYINIIPVQNPTWLHSGEGGNAQ